MLLGWNVIMVCSVMENIESEPETPEIAAAILGKKQK